MQETLHSTIYFEDDYSDHFFVDEERCYVRIMPGSWECAVIEEESRLELQAGDDTMGKLQRGWDLASGKVTRENKERFEEAQ